MTTFEKPPFWFLSFQVLALVLLTLTPIRLEARQLLKPILSSPYPLEEIALPALAKPQVTFPQARPTLFQNGGRSPIVTAGNIYFDQTRQSISLENTRLLKQIMTTLETKSWKLHIEGVCDERGTRAYNMVQAHHQATHVYNYLVNLGMKERQLSSTGLAEVGHPVHDIQLQHTFHFLALGQARQGCVTQLQLEAGLEWQQAQGLIQHNPFLQRIHLTDLGAVSQLQHR